MRPALCLLFCLAACSGSCGSELPQRTSAPLGRPAPPLQDRVPELDRELPPPVCEASALLMLSDHTWLVADNEIHGNLFGFARAFDEATPFEMPGGNRPRDIEALARVGESEFLVVGSHSNKRDGTFSGKRHRLRWLRFVSHREGAEEVHFADASESRWRESADVCGSELFEDALRSAEHGATEEHAGSLVERFCAVLLSAGEMDIEGAASIGGRVWLGFRRPLIDGHAVMARLSGYQLRFDAIELVDLGGRGIRGMDDYDGQLYVIGGPSDDTVRPHVLFAVSDGEAQQLAELPPFTEGVAVHSPGHALVVTDGAEGDIVCDEASRVKTITFSLPGSPPQGSRSEVPEAPESESPAE